MSSSDGGEVDSAKKNLMQEFLDVVTLRRPGIGFFFFFLVFIAT